MNNVKKLEQVYAPEGQPGFLGPGHVARPVIQVDFSVSDPFIMLMDDMLDKKDEVPAGGPHPHAGFETVTLVLEGELGEGDDSMKAGDFEMMTAGSGVVHTETITKKTKLRILQLWLNLPKKQRWAQPRLQKLKAEDVPFIEKDGAALHVYSGAFAGLTSPVKNHTPVIIADIRLEAGKSLQELIPGNFTTFIYVLQGGIRAGDESAELSKDQVGWFDRSTDQMILLKLQAENDGARFVLYSAQPQEHEIVSHGPFIADSMDEIKDLYAQYRQGNIKHIKQMAHG